jgi:hypothetical protein
MAGKIQVSANRERSFIPPPPPQTVAMSCNNFLKCLLALSMLVSSKQTRAAYFVTVIWDCEIFIDFHKRMLGDSIANLKLFPSDEESSDSSLPFEPDPGKDKDPPNNPRFVTICEDIVY